MDLHITTPFGRRPVTPAQIRAQTNADGCPRETTVHKWKVFRDIAAARIRLGLGDRALAVLDALLTFHPETALAAGEGPGLVVFPSNAALALRAHGIAEATLRRHLAALVEAGLLIRRDSPNGKRYIRRGQGGAIAQAYGFDLTPLVARAEEIATLAAEVRAEAQALRVARERVTLLRRDCAKLIQALEAEEGAPGAAVVLRDRYAAVVGALPRVPAPSHLEEAGTALAALAADVGKLLIAHHKTSESSGTPDQSERHKQNSNPDIVSSEQAFGLEMKRSGAPPRDKISPTGGGDPRGIYPLRFVLDACPGVADFAREGIRSWGDLADTAEKIRPMLGISPDAWLEACQVMGDAAAAVTVAAIFQRAEHIKSPGGYLRALVERKRRGEFSLGPVLQALMRAQLQTLPGQPRCRHAAN
ncbi:replication initiation protein RepC [Methylobacterium sp. 2A]|uniref:plasmid replication protein RepC n=2 Tax=Bacteria TaxID=2 RepID=UPI001355A44C|nr:plasmid replication protein RepC [Methylobacterium sp. 2A]MWV26269.1 replication initiation protein RepC [Methylobacterium sp. 2A]